MAGFTDFLKNSVGSLVGLLPAVFSSNYRKKLFGSGLTDAEKEANQFESQQAERQMAFQQQMSNTQYQRGVADMQNAGLNPALMYGNGASGASSPAGAMAASESPSQLDPVGLIGQIANLQLLRAQRKNIEADTRGKIADAENKEASTVESRSRTALNNLAMQYYPKISEATLSHISAEISKFYSDISVNPSKIADYSASAALKDSQRYINEISADWMPRLNAAKEKGDLASAAAAFAEAAYKNYFITFAKEHGGQLPGFNQALGIAAAISDVIEGFGLPKADKSISEIDWKNFLFKPFGYWKELFGKSE